MVRILEERSIGCADGFSMIKPSRDWRERVRSVQVAGAMRSARMNATGGL